MQSLHRRPSSPAVAKGIKCWWMHSWVQHQTNWMSDRNWKFKDSIWRRDWCDAMRSASTLLYQRMHWKLQNRYLSAVRLTNNAKDQVISMECMPKLRMHFARYLSQKQCCDANRRWLNHFERVWAVLQAMRISWYIHGRWIRNCFNACETHTFQFFVSPSSSFSCCFRFYRCLVWLLMAIEKNSKPNQFAFETKCAKFMSYRVGINNLIHLGWSPKEL